MRSTVSAPAITARIDRLPAYPGMWGWVARLSLGGFFEVWDLTLTALLSPLLVKSGVFHKSDGLFGLPDQATFAFVTMAGLYVGALGFSSVVDRYSRRAVFVASMVWYTLATLLMGLQDSSTGIFVLRFVAGIGLGMEMVVIDCYLNEIAPKGLRGRVFSISKFVQLCAIPACGAFAYLGTPHDWLGVEGWRWMAFIPAFGAVLVLLLRRGLPESPPWLAVHGNAEEADRIVSAMEERVRQRDGRALPEPALPAVVAAASSRRYRDLFRPPHRARVLMLITSTSASSIAFYGFAHWAPTLLQEQGASIGKSFLYTALIGIAYPLSPLIAALFADRLERKWQIAWSGTAVAILGLMFAHSTAAWWVVLGVLLTLCNEIKATAAHTYRSELFPTDIRARAVGFVYSFSRIASGISSYLIAMLLTWGGVEGVFAFMAFMMMFSVVATLIWGPRSLGRSYEEIDDPGAVGRRETPPGASASSLRS